MNLLYKYFVVGIQIPNLKKNVTHAHANTPATAKLAIY